MYNLPNRVGSQIERAPPTACLQPVVMEGGFPQAPEICFLATEGVALLIRSGGNGATVRDRAGIGGQRTCCPSPDRIERRKCCCIPIATFRGTLPDQSPRVCFAPLMHLATATCTVMVPWRRRQRRTSFRSGSLPRGWRAAARVRASRR